MGSIESKWDLPYTEYRPNVCINLGNPAALIPQLGDSIQIMEVLWLVNFRLLVEMRMRHSL